MNCVSIQPKFYWNQRTTVTFGVVDFSLLWRHIDSVKQEPLDVINTGAAFSGTFNGQQVNFGRIKAYNYFDTTIRVSATDNVELTFNIQNLLDRKPPQVGSTIGNTSFDSGNTYPATYDTLGRKFAVGAKLKF